MTLVHTFSVGRVRCHLLDAGRQHLDGGAMFGVVPKPLWEKKITPDERNRIPLAMRTWLIEHDAGLVLVDDGLGNKEDEKFRRIYGIENAGETGPTRLDDAIRAAGHSSSDIRYVINTHLHFDHAGGNTVVDASGHVGLAFPNATYVVQRGELEFATHTNERTGASYLPHNFDPVTGAGRWRLLDGNTEVLPGVSVVLTPGHVPFHQSVILRDGGATACFLADLVPTTAHLPLPWIMGYDVEPLRTLESKRQLLDRAVREEWLLIFEHDAENGIGRVRQDGKSFIYQRLDTP